MAAGREQGMERDVAAELSAALRSLALIVLCLVVLIATAVVRRQAVLTSACGIVVAAVVLALGATLFPLLARLARAQAMALADAFLGSGYSLARHMLLASEDGRRQAAVVLPGMIEGVLGVEGVHLATLDEQGRVMETCRLRVRTQRDTRPREPVRRVRAARVTPPDEPVTRHHAAPAPLLPNSRLRRQELPAAEILICQEQAWATYLIRLDATGCPAGLTCHADARDAESQAAFEYGAGLGPWREVHSAEPSTEA